MLRKVLFTIIVTTVPLAACVGYVTGVRDGLEAIKNSTEWRLIQLEKNYNRLNDLKTAKDLGETFFGIFNQLGKNQYKTRTRREMAKIFQNSVDLATDRGDISVFLHTIENDVRFGEGGGCNHDYDRETRSCPKCKKLAYSIDD